MNNLLNFPTSCFIDRLVPKAKFVKASDTPSAVRDLLTREFEQVRLLYVLRADTLNVEPGEGVTEIDVFYFRAKEDSYSVNPLCGLDDLVPRHTLYIVDHGDKTDVLMQHKRRIVAGGTAKWKREVSYWLQEVKLDELHLHIDGMNLDRIYLNLLSQVAGYRIETSEVLLQIKELEETVKRKRRQAETLQRQVRAERQFNRQIELNSQTRLLKKEIAELETELNKLKITK